jgi:hypothetical protein
MCEIAWGRIFTYDNGALIWRVRPRPRVSVGSTAGSSVNKGHRRIKFKGKIYQAHRIVWEMHNGKIPEGMQIDHINGVYDDNRLENLQLVTQQGNVAKAGWQKIRSSNKSGFPGVRWRESHNKWAAYMTIDGIKKHLGYYSTREEAIAARVSALETLDKGIRPNE